MKCSLGFAAGVMIAASFWSLLDPAIEMAEQSEIYGKNGEYAFVPVAIGFFLGGLFVYLTDLLISRFGACIQHPLLPGKSSSSKQKTDINMSTSQNQESSVQINASPEGMESIKINVMNSNKN